MRAATTGMPHGRPVLKEPSGLLTSVGGDRAIICCATPRDAFASDPAPGPSCPRRSLARRCFSSGRPCALHRRLVASDLAQSVMGAPADINRSIYWVVNIIAPHAFVWNSLFVVVQVSLGLSLLLGRFERAAIVASIPWALGIWWVGEGFGMLPTGFALLAAGAPGAVLLYVLLGLLAWPAKCPHPGQPFIISWPAGAVAWVTLWAGQSLLQLPWKFPAGQVLSANIVELSSGQPAWLLSIAHHAQTLVSHHAVAVSIAMVVGQATVGVGILDQRTRRPALVAGMVVSLIYWFAFQYLGTIPGGDATDPNSAPLLILLAAALWPAASKAPATLEASRVNLRGPEIKIDHLYEVPGGIGTASCSDGARGATGPAPIAARTSPRQAYAPDTVKMILRTAPFRFSRVKVGPGARCAVAPLRAAYFGERACLRLRPDLRADGVPFWPPVCCSSR